MRAFCNGCVFLHNADLLPYIELLLVFDGLDDALPAWPECEALEAEQGLQVLRHYQPFGLTNCFYSALYFARGNYVLWDQHEIACVNLLCLMEQLPQLALDEPLSLQAHAASGGAKTSRAAPFFLLNQAAVSLLQQQRKMLAHWQQPIKENLARHVRQTLKRVRAQWIMVPV